MEGSGSANLPPMMSIPRGLFTITKEILRHILRRPVVGICVLGRTPDGRILLIRRADTGQWALPGGTLEWGETLRACAQRELDEEGGVDSPTLGRLLGVYSDLDRDPRFHAVTIVVEATIEEPKRSPHNPAEILEVGLFDVSSLPPTLSHGGRDMLQNALSAALVWE
jgi:8-oxo-dGTP diphosphatase